MKKKVHTLLSEDGLLLIEMFTVGNEETHEIELGLIERDDWAGIESVERSDRVERAAEEDITQAIFFSSSLWEELVTGLSEKNILVDLKLA